MRWFLSLLVVVCLGIGFLFFYKSGPDYSCTYSFIDEPIDVIMPCTAKDKDTLECAIDGILKNGKNIRRVIVISKEKLTDKAEWFPEQQFPFTKEQIALEIFSKPDLAEQFLKTANRIGWIYQQLLKFYASYVIPDISSNILILDSDTVFLNPYTFLNSYSLAGKFNVGKEYHKPYFKHAKKLIPGFKKVYPEYSGICHWMVMQRTVLDHLFKVVEKNHKIPFWKAFCRCIDKKKASSSCASEYEIYFNFALMSSNQFEINLLKWKNIADLDFEKYQSKFDYVSSHDYLRVQ